MSQYLYSFRWACLVLAIAMLSCRANAQLLASTLEDAMRSIVLIQDGASFGSGIVLDEQGTILTNYHVVNSPLPLKVSVKVEDRGSEKGWEEVDFEEVERVGYHPRLDLALIRIKPKTHKLFPAILDKQVPKVGTRVVALGNPSSSDGKPNRDRVSWGMISAPVRIVQEEDKARYLQYNAQTFPGNSGGALVTREGRVIGVVTMRAGELAKQAFAIPIDEYDAKVFAPLDKRKRDPKLAAKRVKLVDDPDNYYRHREPRLNRYSFERIEILKTALAADPLCAAAYEAIAKELRLGVGMDEQATWYYKAAAEADPTLGSAAAEAVFGLISIDKLEDAQRVVDKALPKVKQTEELAQLTASAGFLRAKQGQNDRAAYLLAWSKKLAPELERPTGRDDALFQAMGKLSAEQVRAIADLRDAKAYSISGLARFAREAPKQPIKPSLKSRPGKVLIEEAVRRAFDPALESKPVIESVLPTEAERVWPAYFGMYAVLEFSKLKRIGVMNLSSGKMLGFIPLPDPDALVAAGGRILLIYLPGEDQWQSWDLESLEMIVEVPNTSVWPVKSITMASDVEDQAIVVLAHKHPKSSNGQAKLHRFDVSQLRVSSESLFEIDVSITQGHTSHGTLSVCVDDDFSKVAYLDRADHSNYRAIRIRSLDRKQADRDAAYAFTTSSPSGTDYRSDIRWSLNGKGTHLFTNDGRVITVQGDAVDRVNNSRLYPVIGSSLALESISARPKQLRSPVNLGTEQTIEWPKISDLRGSKRMIASARSQRVMVVCSRRGKHQVVLLKIQASAEAAPSAQPGADWKQSLNFPAGSKVTLAHGPDGMRLSADGKQLQWRVPKDHEGGVIEVLLNVVTPDGKDTYERVHITVEPK